MSTSVRAIVAGLFFLLIFLFLTAATETLGLPVVSMWLSVITGFVPKILAVALALLIFLPWMINVATDFARHMFDLVPVLVG